MLDYFVNYSAVTKIRSRDREERLVCLEVLEGTGHHNGKEGIVRYKVVAC